MTHDGIDDSEAALYDRQIRLWGVEAQNRMRKASVLLITLRGLATEVAKNLVLAGIGSLTLLDPHAVCAEDLEAGYFFRESEVGTNRARAARGRIQSLNPRVKVVALSSFTLADDLNAYDLVCATDLPISSSIELNKRCRKTGTPMYAAASLGLSGYIFADLLEHDFIVERADPRSSAEDPTKIALRRHQSFVTLSDAITTLWTDQGAPLRLKAIKRMLPLVEIIAFLRGQERCKASPDFNSVHVEAQSLLEQCHCDHSLLNLDRLGCLIRTATYEFAPTCAILGGVLAQDILNALGGREAPLVNFFVLDGESNTGDIFAVGGVQRN